MDVSIAKALPVNNAYKHAFLIGAPHSNSGKTLATLGLIKALCNRGLAVQPYKCGPDYIDPMFHKQVAQRPSYNLDVWMDTEENTKKIFANGLAAADVAIAEGVMGLFDGAVKQQGSSAHLARLLSLPIVLVIDASKMAYSAAPLLYGFKNFDPDIRLAGVIFNKTGSDKHLAILADSAHDAGVDVLGHIPRDSRLAVESRHLGLLLPGESLNMAIVDTAAALVARHVDLERLLNVSRMNKPLPPVNQTVSNICGKTIAVANDAAFNFTYQANLDALAQIGRIEFFSPMHDTKLPDADILWLPGGYPELFADTLSGNSAMLAGIKHFVEAGKTVVAECGGMMYLGQSITAKDGKSFAMAGVFDFSTSFENMKLHLGYREINLNGMSLKGHEFHYSQLTAVNETPFMAKTVSAQQQAVDMPLFRHKNCWASYMHLYLGNASAMSHFLNILNHE